MNKLITAHKIFARKFSLKPTKIKLKNNTELHLNEFNENFKFPIKIQGFENAEKTSHKF